MEDSYQAWIFASFHFATQNPSKRYSPRCASCSRSVQPKICSGAVVSAWGFF